MTTINKPIIETIINSIALSMTALGMVMVTDANYTGFLVILFGVALEFFKYWGRKVEYW